MTLAVLKQKNKNKKCVLNWLNLWICLVRVIEKWEDRKWWEDRKVRGQKIFNFPSCVFGWRDRKMEGQKTYLFG